MRDDDGVFLRF